MLKALPFLWSLLAALGAAAQLFVARMSGGAAMGTMLFSAASAVLITTVSTIGMVARRSGLMSKKTLRKVTK